MLVPFVLVPFVLVPFGVEVKSIAEEAFELARLRRIDARFGV